MSKGLNKCLKENMNVNYLKGVTKNLIFGSFHAIDDKNIIIKLINEIINL